MSDARAADSDIHAADQKKLVFLSHASSDQETAFHLCQLLEEQGIGCWIAPRDVPLGADYGEAIIRAIEATSTMVLFLSSHANASVHVKHEVERATSKGKRVMPVRVEEVLPSPSLELHLATAHWLDAFRLSPDQAAKQLAVALRGEATATPSTSPAFTPTITPADLMSCNNFDVELVDAAHFSATSANPSRKEKDPPRLFLGVILSMVLVAALIVSYFVMVHNHGEKQDLSDGTQSRTGNGEKNSKLSDIDQNKPTNDDADKGGAEPKSSSGADKSADQQTGKGKTAIESTADKDKPGKLSTLNEKHEVERILAAIKNQPFKEGQIGGRITAIKVKVAEKEGEKTISVELEFSGQAEYQQPITFAGTATVTVTIVGEILSRPAVGGISFEKDKNELFQRPVPNDVRSVLLSAMRSSIQERLNNR